MKLEYALRECGVNRVARPDLRPSRHFLQKDCSEAANDAQHSGAHHKDGKYGQHWGVAVDASTATPHKALLAVVAQHASVARGAALKRPCMPKEVTANTRNVVRACVSYQ
jgi:hypothetical protein